MNILLGTFALGITVLAVTLAGPGQTYQRVEAGGPVLRMLIQGQGQPAVVFEAGAGGSLEVWSRVQPEISTFARTVSYDRAGNGLSTRGRTARDGRHIAVELHTALQHAGVPPPYVLVGHSLGGPFVRVFAGLYPQEVAGLVLVDPTQEDFMAWARARDPKPVVPRTGKPRSEVDCAPLTFAQAQANPLPGPIPIRLISGLGPSRVPAFLTPELRAEVEKDQKIFYPAKRQFHGDWVRSHSGGQLIVTTNSGHGIPLEEPAVVIRTIRELLGSQ